MEYIKIAEPRYPVGARFAYPGTGTKYMITASELSYRSVFVEKDQRYITYHYEYSLINVDNTSSELGFGMLVSEVILTEQWTRLEDGTE